MITKYLAELFTELHENPHCYMIYSAKNFNAIVLDTENFKRRLPKKFFCVLYKENMLREKSRNGFFVFFFFLQEGGKILKK
jgi:hypothetical protein